MCANPNAREFMYAHTKIFNVCAPFLKETNKQRGILASNKL